MDLYATVGITVPNLTAEPLGTEGEMTPGPDDENPYETGETGKQPTLAPLLGGREPAADTVDDVTDDAEDRNRRLDAVFEFGAGAPDEPPQF